MRKSSKKKWLAVGKAAVCGGLGVVVAMWLIGLAEDKWPEAFSGLDVVLDIPAMHLNYLIAHNPKQPFVALDLKAYSKAHPFIYALLNAYLVNGVLGGFGGAILAGLWQFSIKPVLKSDYEYED